jgi:hypothetical protein
MSVALSVAFVIAMGTAAVPQDEDEWLREPICGFHRDFRGFSVNLPAPLCGHRYLHGVWVQLSPTDAPIERSIVVWASGNANFYKRSRDIAVAAVDAMKPESIDGVHVTSRSSRAVSGVPAERWHYTFRPKADQAVRVVDLVAVLRPLRPIPKWSDYYEYSISLNSTPQHYGADLKVFEAIVDSLAFSEPEI